MQGWIKLHRQIQDNELYFSERFTRAQAWIDLLLLANHKSATVFLRGVEVRLLPGQLAWAQKSLAERWKWNHKTVKQFLANLERREMIEADMSNVTTIITIRNWHRYQHTEPEATDYESAGRGKPYPPSPAPSAAEVEAAILAQSDKSELNGEQNGAQTESNTVTDKNVKNVHTENTSSSSDKKEEDEEVIFENEFFRVTKEMLATWKKSYPNIKSFHPELTRISDVLKEKSRAGVKIYSPLAFLHSHLSEANKKSAGKQRTREGDDTSNESLRENRRLQRVGDVRTLEEILGPLVKVQNGEDAREPG